MYSPATFNRRQWRAKNRERNLLAAVLSIIVIALLSTSLAQPKWFYFKGGECTKKHLGVYEFFYIGYFELRFKDIVPSENDGGVTELVYHSYNEILKNCVTPKIVALMRVIIAFVFLGIISSLFAFFVDTVGVLHKVFKTIKRNAVGSIFTVIFCVTVIGLCYYVSTLIAEQQELTKINRGTRIEVKFDVSFYLITAAGSVAVLASAANLLKRYSTEDNQDDVLLEDYDGLETFSVNFLSRPELSHVPFVAPPPPPPYTP